MLRLPQTMTGALAGARGHRDARRGRTWCALSELVELSGVSTSTVQRALSDLQAKRLADTVNKGVNKGLWQMNP